MFDRNKKLIIFQELELFDRVNSNLTQIHLLKNKPLNLELFKNTEALKIWMQESNHKKWSLHKKQIKKLI